MTMYKQYGRPESDQLLVRNEEQKQQKGSFGRRDQVQEHIQTGTWCRAPQIHCWGASPWVGPAYTSWDAEPVKRTAPASRQ